MADPQADITALKAALAAPNMRDMLLPTRTIAGKMFTYDEALTFVENLANGLTRSPRLPITVTAKRAADGTLTLQVTPDGPPT